MPPAWATALLTKLDSLQQSFDTKIKYDLDKERIIDRLHHELQAKHDDFYRRMLRPVLLDLIAMHDDLGRLLESRWDTDLASFRASVEDLLGRYGATAFSLEGDAVVRERQRVVATVATHDPEQEGRIAARRRQGFTYEEQILRPELVTAYRYIAPPDSQEELPL